MELLDRLEKRMEELFAKIILLQKEKASLEQENCEAVQTLQSENTSLKEALLLEQQRNALVLERVEKILQQVKEQAEKM